MQDIDFLPQRYRDAHAQRTRKVWGLVVVLLYAGLLCTSGYLQRSGQSRLKRDLAAANEQRTMVTAQAARLSAVQTELKQAEARANLIVYLRHPWPRTQIVAAVVAPISPGLSLDELRVQRSEITQVVRQRTAPVATSETKPDSRCPAERDLEQLRDTCDGNSVTVTLKGTADEVSLVHMYLGRIGKDPLFSCVDLMNIDGQDAQRQGTTGCRFTARLVVRPGYGQPQGPTPAAVAAVERTPEVEP